MIKRFAVALGNTTKAQDDDFVTYLKGHDMAWWRYIGNFWLLIDYNDKLSAESLRDDLLKIFSNVHHIVLDISNAEQGEWAGYGPNKEPNNMFQWLHDTWDHRG